MPTVKELKAELKDKGLKVSGKKSELEERLEDYNDLDKDISDKALYMKAREKVKNRVKVWPSAYASGQVVTEYKKMGGTYKGKKDSKKGIDRWFKEEWVNVCEPKKGGGYKKCGRDQSKIIDYPYCRPSKRVTKGTPMTVSELKKKKGKEYLEKLCKKKRKEALPKDGKARQISVKHKK